MKTLLNTFLLMVGMLALIAVHKAWRDIERYEAGPKPVDYKRKWKTVYITDGGVCWSMRVEEIVMISTSIYFVTNKWESEDSEPIASMEARP